MDFEEIKLQELAEKVMAEEYDVAVTRDAKIAKLQKAAKEGIAKYRAAEEIASRTGMHTADVLLTNLADLYPDGKIPEEDAKALITPMLRHNYEYVSEYAKEAQETMNKDIGVSLNAVVPEFDRNRADGIAVNLAKAEDFTQRQDSFRLNVENHSRNIVDESQKQNMRLHDRVGLEAEVDREYDGVGLHDGQDTCEWCESRAGVWGYRDAIANGVFERHPGCGCVISYTSRKGVTTIQARAGGNWENPQKDTRENRKNYNIDSNLERLYNNSPGQKSIGELREIYAEDVRGGWISSLSGFNNYLKLYAQIENEVIGQETSNGIVIKGQSRHFMQRVIGTARDPKIYQEDHRIVKRSGVEIDDIIKAVKSGKPSPVIERKDGRSIVFVGEKCKVSVNPDTGTLIQCNPR